MSEPEASAGSLASCVTMHGDATIAASDPLTIATPRKRWSYAASVPIAAPGAGDFVVEAVLRVAEGSVGVGCTDASHASIAGETLVEASQEPIRLELLSDPEHAAYLLIRSWAHGGPALVEIHSVRSRVLTADERGAIAAPAALTPVPRWSRYYGTPGETIAERVRVRDFLRLAAPKRRPWIEDLTVVVQPGDQLSRALHVSGLYEPNTAVVLKRLLAPGATFLDLGAHAGVFTMLGSRFVGPSGRVFSFEPSARERARLEEHVALNALTNVTVVPSAVADYAGRATLKVAADGYGGLNTLGSRFAYDGVEAVGSFEVEITTLDAFVERARLRRVDAIKLDIEGAECAALRGAARVLREGRPALLIEVVAAALDANGASARELEALLHDAGYDIYRIDDERAELEGIAGLDRVDGQNVVALPVER